MIILRPIDTYDYPDTYTYDHSEPILMFIP